MKKIYSTPTVGIVETVRREVLCASEGWSLPGLETEDDPIF